MQNRVTTTNGWGEDEKRLQEGSTKMNPRLSLARGPIKGLKFQKGRQEKWFGEVTKKSRDPKVDPTRGERAKRKSIRRSIHSKGLQQHCYTGVERRGSTFRKECRNAQYDGRKEFVCLKRRVGHRDTVGRLWEERCP